VSDPHKTHRAQLFQAAELLQRILAAQLPADRQMELYFREHRNMGARDRGFVAECVYGCLRQLNLLDHLAGSPTNPEVRARALVAAWLLHHAGWPVEAVAAKNLPLPLEELAQRVASLDPATLPFPLRTALPEWLAERLLAQYGEEQAAALGAALNRPATLDLRINPLRGDRAQVRRILEDEGFPADPTPFSPWGLRRESRAPLFRLESFREGWYEVQDEGSQLISLLVAPKPREQVVDFCAGAGGKTLHLGAMMNNSGSLYAYDVAPRRLENLRPRLRRSGLDNVRLFAIEDEDDPRLERFAATAHRVLVDAPCSGTGTLRRNPDIKWRPIDLPAITTTQGRILNAAARLLRPGGRLVYATCSLLREENEAVVTAFLQTHPDFRVQPATEVLAGQGIHLPDAATPEGFLRLTPHRHGTDGFFAAVLERAAQETEIGAR
jgi:16S rRNA (cytosine967-C5)-methyltransferase